MEISQAVTGLIMIFVGVVLIGVGLFFWPALIYGIPILLFGVLILLNVGRERKIERIKKFKKGKG